MNDELYNKLKSARLYTNSLEEFNQKYGTPEGQLVMFNLLSGNKLYTNDFASFQAKYFNSQQPTEERSFLGAIPLIGESIHSGGKAIESFVQNDVPMMYNQLKEADTSFTLKGLEKIKQEYKDRPEELANILTKLESQGVQARNTGETGGEMLNRQQGGEINNLIQQENNIQFYKDRGGEKLKNNIQNLTDVKSASDFMNWLGTSVGQMGAQIPLSVLSGGTSSFLMESAAVYDEQLDLLAEKYNISRAEVIEKGLDDPAAGQAYAVLAGALDAVSAGSVLQLFKKAGTKGLKESVIKTTLKNAGGEFFTEGAQGQLTTKGATVGAGTEFTFDLEKFFNEAAAGAVGGGGIGLAGNAFSKKDPVSDAIAEAQQIDHEQAIVDSSTGDKTLDSTIDGLEMDDVDYINRLTAELDKIEGGKIEQQIIESEKAVETARTAQDEAERKQLIAEKFNEFQESPTIPRNLDPISQANAITDEEALLSDDSAAGMSVNMVTKKTTTPKYDPKTLDEIGSQPATSFEVSDGLGGLATGKIVGEVAVLDEIFAGKDKEGNVLRGGKLYQKVIDKLKNSGATKLRVGMQSTNSQQALKNLIKDGILSVNEQGGKDISGNPIDFYIGKAPKVRTAPITKSAVRAKAKVNTPKLAPEIKAPVVKTKELPKPKIEVLQKETQEDTQEKVVKFKKQLANALKYKATKKLATLEALATKAENAGLVDMAKEISGYADAEANRQTDKTTAKEQKAAKPKDTAAERKAKRDTANAEKAAVRAKKPENKKVMLKATPELGKAYSKDQQTTLGIAKNAFNLAISKSMAKEQGVAALDNLIKKYQEFRAENNLKEVTVERIKRQAELSLTAARKSILADGRAKTRERNSEMDAEKAAMEQIRSEVAKDLGISPEDVDLGFSPATTSKEFGSQVLDYIKKNNIHKFKRAEMTQEAYIALAPKSQHGILNGLSRLINQYHKKQGSSIKYIRVVIPKGVEVKLGGLYADSQKSDSGYLMVLVNEETGRPISQESGRNVVLHENIHAYAALMASRLYNKDKSFTRAMDRVFDKITGTVRNRAFSMFKKLNKSFKDTQSFDLTSLSEDELQLYFAIENTIAAREGNQDLLLNLATETPGYAVDTLFNDDNFYAFHDTAEFIAEGLSDPETLAFLSSISLGDTITNGVLKGTKKSLLYRWYEDFFEWTKSRIKFTVADNNSLDYFMNTIAMYDEDFSNTDLERNSEQPFTELVSISNMKTPGEVKKANVKVNNKIALKLVKTLENRDFIESLNDVIEYVNRVNKRLPARTRLGEDYPKVIWAKIIKLRKERVAYNTIKVNALAVAIKSDKYQTDDKFAQDVTDFASIDTKDLSLAHLRSLAIGFGKLSMDQVVDKASYDIMINEGKVKPAVAAMESIAPKLKKKGWLMALSGFTGAMTFSSVVGKYNKEVADKFAKYVYSGLMRANAKSGIEADRFWKGLSDTAIKHKVLTHKNLVKIGIYGSVFSTKFSPSQKIEWQQEIIENATFALEASKSKLDAKMGDQYKHDLNTNQINVEIETAQEILNKVQKNLSMDNILSKEEKYIYDAIRAFADKHENNFFRNAVAIWGNTGIEKRFNYFPTLAQGRTNANKDKTAEKDPIIRDNSDSLFDSLSEGSAGDYAAVGAKKAWSNYNKINPKGYYYDVDALAIGKRWSKTMLYDIYASTELRTLNRMFSSTKFSKAMGNKLFQATLASIKSAAGAGFRYDPSNSKAWKNVMSGRDNLYMATLATSGQFIAQASSGFAGAMVLSASMNPLKTVKNFSKSVEAASASLTDQNKFYDLLREKGFGIQVRDIGLERYLSPEDYRGSVGKGILRKFAENSTDFFIRNGDKYGARLVWFSAFHSAGGTLENPTKEAILYAERMTGNLQGMSDIKFMPSFFKPDTQGWTKKILIGMIFPYKMFSVNSFVNIVNSAPKVLQSAEARKVFASHVFGMAFYHAVTIMAIRPLYKAIVDSLAGDDEEEEEQTLEKKIEDIAYSTAWDISVGSWSPAMFDQLGKFVLNKQVGADWFAEPFAEFDQYKDSPLPGPVAANDIYKSLLGPGLREPVEIIVDAAIALNFQQEADREYTDIFNQNGFNWEQVGLKMITEGLAMNTLTPMRGDLKRIMEGYIRKRKKMFNAQKNLGGGKGSGTINDSEYTQDIEFQDIFEEAMESPVEFENENDNF